MNTATQSELIQAIRSHCKKCRGAAHKIASCTVYSCEFYNYRDVNIQITLFGGPVKEIWYGQCLEVAKTLGSQFYFSELRSRCPGPAHKNWWGGLGKFLMAHGYERSQNNRKNPLPITKGAEDYVWCKK